MEPIDFFSLLEKHSTNPPVDFWLKDRQGDSYTSWTFAEGYAEIKAIAAWIEDRFGDHETSMALLSRNRAHWILADMAIMGSGNVTIPLFTTMKPNMIEYINDLTDTRVLFLGESINWDAVSHTFSDEVTIVALPGVDPGRDHIKWDDILADYKDRSPDHVADPHALATIVFTSGTTGKPKGVMNSQASLIIPSYRGRAIFTTERMFSYLPLSHIAERGIVETTSLTVGSSIYFNESLETLNRDLVDYKPGFLFGPPRVWEQMQQGILAKFGGSQQALDQALAAGGEALKAQIRAGLGLDQAQYLLSAAAPIAPSLIRWFHALGLKVLEAFGQSELMSVLLNKPDDYRIGSIGKPVEGVEVKISDEGEMAIRADGQSLGYYKRPTETAETFRDGWVYTGDKVRCDEDGFYYITGRVKDTFKTIQGKFVSPAPIENIYASAGECEQICLLGRGYHKPVMVCVLAATAADMDQSKIEAALIAHAEEVNGQVEKHARIGAIIVSKDPWTIEDGILTHTMKIRREKVEERYGDLARELSLKSAEQHHLITAWA